VKIRLGDKIIVTVHGIFFNSDFGIKDFDFKIKIIFLICSRFNLHLSKPHFYLIFLNTTTSVATKPPTEQTSLPN
ncbi:MAG: hypothetical protein LBP59_12950, partial [Planctomycetaceae bacterium]|nr:hypothetical protein [Planctomycetaceae bacterium]